MTTSSVRLMAVGIALAFAVLTGLFTGMVGGGQVCTTAEPPSGRTPGQDQQEGETPGTGRRAPGGQGSAEPQPPGEQPGQGQDPAEQPTEPTPGGLPGNPDGETGSDGTATVQDARRAPLAVPAQQACPADVFSVPAAMAGFFGALLAGGAVAALLFVRRRDPGAATAPAVTEHGNRPPDQLEGERSTLIQTCIYVRDRATSKALADRLGWALQEVGVTTVTPNGATFDPAHHEAGGAATTNDPAQAGTIAAVEVPGYVDRGVVLRAPVVTVYRRDGQ